ncbi:MAG: tetratricopeptide repeat protein [Longimicrobiaceae bacterium]
MKIRFSIHRPKFLDFENLHDAKAFTLSLQPAVLTSVLAFAVLLRDGFLVALMGALLVFVGTAGGMGFIALILAHNYTRGVMSFIAPSGGSTPSPDDYSYEKALLARGKADEALLALDVRLANNPDDPALCLFAADAYAREGRNPAKAERLFSRVREMEGASPEQDYRATNRLIDLYLGPLDDPARAEAELERIRLRHAGTTAAAHAGQALRTLRGTSS